MNWIQAEGTANPSYTSYSLEKLDQARDAASEEARIQSTAATMYTGKGCLVSGGRRLDDLPSL